MCNAAVIDHYSNSDPSGSYYWAYTTREFKDSNVIAFGTDMAGVANPIVTHFTPRWPVSSLSNCNVI